MLPDVDAIADAVALMVQTAIAPFAERLAVLETRAGELAKAADLDTLRADLVTKITVLDANRIPGPPGPPGPAGADGVNGKDGAPGLRYVGVYVDGKAYEAGDVVTWRGSAWHCDGPSDAAPDTGRPWQLIVKAGRDGRDRRLEAAK